MELHIQETSKPVEKKIVGVQLPMEMYTNLKKVADRECMTISTLIRVVLNSWLLSPQSNEGTNIVAKLNDMDNEGKEAKDDE